MKDRPVKTCDECRSVYFAETPWLFLSVYYGAPTLNSQRRHLIAVEEHIAKITPQGEKFRADHPCFQDVKLFAYTDGDGMFGANGYVASDKHVSELKKFMEGTGSPRPIHVGSVHVVGPEFFEFQKKSELNGAANGSRPIRSETNSRSPAAGSRR
jgi:hypothetical protein